MRRISHSARHGWQRPAARKGVQETGRVRGKADRRQIKFYRGIASRFRHKGRVALALLHHAAKIQLGHGSLTCKGGGVGQQTAVFGNQIVPAKVMSVVLSPWPASA